jgi:hypothetical protein
MAQLITSERIKGLIPILGRTQGNEVRVINGKNFDFTAAGPRSAFGSNLVGNSPVLTDYPFPQVFPILNTSFMFDRDTVYKLCPFEVCFKFETGKYCAVDICHKWSMAYVGDTYYFSRPDVGIIQYDVITNEWEQWDSEQFQVINFHPPVYGVTESLNRLIVLGSDTVSWSEIDSGKKLCPDNHTSAGFQSLSLIQYGQPLGVYGSSQGFFTFTTNGIMFSRPTDQNNPFNHSVLSTENVPLNSHAITQVGDGTVAFLSKSGIYLLGRHSNNQFQFEKLEQIMGDYWNTYILPCLTKQCQPNSALFYLPDEDKLFFSVSSTDDNVFDISFVYNFRYEEWSSFNQRHRYIGQVHLGQTEHDTIANGYIDELGFIHQFNHNQNYREQPITGQKLPLDSYIEIGEFRAETQLQYDDTVQLVNSLRISQKMSPKFEGLKTCEPEVQSYIVEIANENCTYSKLVKNRQVKDRQYFNLDNVGEFHTLKISATSPSTYFAIAEIQLTAINAGRK